MLVVNSPEGKFVLTYDKDKITTYRGQTKSKSIWRDKAGHIWTLDESGFKVVSDKHGIHNFQQIDLFGAKENVSEDNS